MKVAEINISELSFEVDSNISIDIVKDKIKHCVTILAATKPVKRYEYISETIIVRTPCYWQKFWWVKILKWCQKNKYLIKLIPKFVTAFTHAEEIEPRYKHHPLKDSAIDSIQAQIAHIKINRRLPKLILVGYKARQDVYFSCRNFGDIYFSKPLNGELELSNEQFKGLTLIVTEKLEQDAVIVI